MMMMMGGEPLIWVCMKSLLHTKIEMSLPGSALTHGKNLKLYKKNYIAILVIGNMKKYIKK